MAFKPSMTADEYWKTIRDILLNEDGYPQEYVDSVEQDARNQYEHDIIRSNQEGKDKLNPEGFCSTCWLFYPDKPDVPPVKGAFNFEFQGVRAK